MIIILCAGPLHQKGKRGERLPYWR